MDAMNKRELRAHLRILHEGSAARDVQSALLCRHIKSCPEYKSARVIGGYMPLAREADVTPILLDALRSGKTLALPLCGDAPHMTLRQVRTLEELIPGRYGLLEPAPNAPVIPVEDVDLLLVPLEGIDQNGFRLGKGGGYYDCLLCGVQVQTLGCVLSWQWADAVPRDEWDQPLTAAADHRGVHYFNR